MPKLSEVTYSREATIAAVTDFYRFLEKMYLPDDAFAEAPEDGWPSITKENMLPLGKDDEVIELMRHLPYGRLQKDDHAYDINCVPEGKFANWHTYGL